jgi:hypothetical protein
MRRTMPRLTTPLAHRSCISTRIGGGNMTLKLDTEPIGHGLPAVSNR